MSTRRILPPSRDRGFALLITITLLAFLVLLLVSLATLTRVETQVAGNNQQLAQARQNALLALNLALGQLQKAAGPDQRVTATAEVLSTTKPSKKKWTGVWDTRSTNLTDAPVWLVSQADPAVAATVTTDAPTLAANENSNTTAVRLVGEKSADISLVGPTGSPNNEGNGVIVPVQDIKSDAVPGASGTTTIGRFGYWVGDEGVKARINLTDPDAAKTDTLSMMNRASVAQRNAWELFSGSTSPTPAATDPATLISATMTEKAGRMVSAQQLKVLASLDSSAPATAKDALTKIATGRFHDYTMWSSGVQADVKNGGLKWDLSSAFEMGSNLDLTNAGNLFATSEFGSNAVQIRDSANVVISPGVAYVASGAPTAPRVTYLFLPQVTFPPNKNFNLRGPTWQALRSHYLLYQGQNPGTANRALTARSLEPNGKREKLGAQNTPASLYEINPNYVSVDPLTNTVAKVDSTNPSNNVTAPRITSTSVAPYMNRMFMRFGIKTAPKIVTNTSGQSTTVYVVQLVMTPFVVLHNPYNVDLKLKSYSGKTNPKDPSSGPIAAQIGLFDSTSAGLPLRLRIKVDGVDFMTGSPGDPVGGPYLLDLGKNHLNGAWPRFKMLIPEMTLKAGEVRVLYPQSMPTETEITTDNIYVTLGTTPNETGGFIFSLLNGVRGNSKYPVKRSDTGNANILPGHQTASANPVNAETEAEFAAAVTANTDAASEIWVKSGAKITAVFNTEDSDLEIKYGIESNSSDDATQGSGDCSLTYQLNAKGPRYYAASASPSGSETYTAEYMNYVRPGGTQRADDYERPAGGVTAGASANTRYIFALDFYTKSADHVAEKSARPFITTNPVAPVNYNDSLGYRKFAGSTSGTRGFPGMAPAYQMDFIDISPSEQGLYNFLYSDNGKANWGTTRDATNTLDSTNGLQSFSLINIPSRPLTSLADFQHANIAMFGYQPYFAIGNSYASPYVPAALSTNPVGFVSSDTNPYFLYDLSYLSNDALWDKYFLSSISHEFNGSSWDNTDTALSASIQTWASGARSLPNTRMVPYNSTRVTAAANLSTLKTAYRQAAASLITLGTFNVNSRSVDAWAAVLGAARDLKIVTNGGSSLSSTTLNNATAVPRMLPAKNKTDSSDSPTSDATWNGFASLSDAQIRQLAKNIVDEITRRQSAPANANPGPFRSLAEFINRNLINDLNLNSGSSPTSTGAKGAIQAALDEPNNPNSPNYRFFNGSSYRDVKAAQSSSKWGFKWKVNGTETDNSLAGQGPSTSTAQGFVLQGDVLQQIGPFLSARSDTFVIRTYGEALSPSTGESAGRAWCEAIVQRLPEYVDQTDAALSTAPSDGLKTALYDATPADKIGTINKAFGRRFKVVSFRWLTAQDI